MNRKEYFERKDCSAINLLRDTEYEIKLSYLKQVIGDFENKDILVLGCGNGKLERKLLDLYNVNSITLVDASKRYIRQAKSNCNEANCICTEFNKIDKRTFMRRFDIIYSFDVMQYLQSSEIKRLQLVLIYYLRGNGRIFHMGIPEKKRRFIYRIEQCITEHSLEKMVYPHDFIDNYSRWVEKKEFISERYNTLFLTPSLKFERFDVIISKNKYEK